LQLQVLACGDGAALHLEGLAQVHPVVQEWDCCARGQCTEARVQRNADCREVFALAALAFVASAKPSA
jgi:hypothetical protein